MSLEELAKCVNDIKYDMNLYEDYVSGILTQKTVKLYNMLKNAPGDVKKEICTHLINAADGKIFTQIWLYSFAVNLTENKDLLTDFINIILQSDKLKKNTLYFLYYQIKGLMFRRKGLSSVQNRYLNWKLLEAACSKFKEELNCNLISLDIEEQNPDVAVVITEQFLAIQHGPTKTALDRCYTLMHRMGKKVVLINTAEVLSMVGTIPFWDKTQGNYIAEMEEISCQEWKGCKIPYVQCENNMPDSDALEYLLNTIYKLRPGIVISIGGSSILAGLVNSIVPTLVVGLTTSEVAPAVADYQILPENMSEDDINLLNSMGKRDEYVIRGRFTFSLKEQTESVTRDMLGLPDDSFLLCVIGSRLGHEVTEDFVGMLNQVLSEKVGVVFIGAMETYHTLCKNNPPLEMYSYYLGYCEDILSRVELCDLYVNPDRKGGGTSVVEAMFKGLPVVTLGYGDVAGIAGKDFCCKDYGEMSQTIIRYVTDKEFYDKQADIAKTTASEYLDSEAEFERCVNIYWTKRQKPTGRE